MKTLQKSFNEVPRFWPRVRPILAKMRLWPSFPPPSLPPMPAPLEDSNSHDMGTVESSAKRVEIKVRVGRVGGQCFEEEGEVEEVEEVDIVAIIATPSRIGPSRPRAPEIRSIISELNLVVGVRESHELKCLCFGGWS